MFPFFSSFGRYLELACWDLKEALQSAKEDREWETDPDEVPKSKSGQISIQVNVQGGGRPMVLTVKGAGHKSYDDDDDEDKEPHRYKTNHKAEEDEDEEEEAKEETITLEEAEEAIAADAAASASAAATAASKANRKSKMIIYSKPPAIATNSVIAHDVYNVRGAVSVVYSFFFSLTISFFLLYSWCPF
jgi:hypothetical protein